MENLYIITVVICIFGLIISQSKGKEACEGGNNETDTSTTVTQIWIVGLFQMSLFEVCEMNKTGTSENKTGTSDENLQILMCAKTCNDTIFFGIQKSNCYCMNRVPDNKGTANIPIKNCNIFSNVYESIDNTESTQKSNISCTDMHKNDTSNNNNSTSTAQLYNGSNNESTATTSPYHVTYSDLTTAIALSLEEKMTVYYKERLENDFVCTAADNNVTHQGLSVRRRCTSVKFTLLPPYFSLNEVDCNQSFQVVCQRQSTNLLEQIEYSTTNDTMKWASAKNFCESINQSLFNGHDFSEDGLESLDISTTKIYWSGRINIHVTNGNITCRKKSTQCVLSTPNKPVSTTQSTTLQGNIDSSTATDSFGTTSNEVNTSYQSDKVQSLTSPSTTESGHQLHPSSTSARTTSTGHHENSVHSLAPSSTTEFVSEHQIHHSSTSTSGPTAENTSSTFLSTSASTGSTSFHENIDNAGSSTTMNNDVAATNRKQSSQTVTIVVPVVVVAVVGVAAVAIVISCKRRQRSKRNGKERFGLKTSHNAQNITPGYPDVDIIEAAYRETPLQGSQVQVENLSRITHINNSYGHVDTEEEDSGLPGNGTINSKASRQRTKTPYSFAKVDDNLTNTGSIDDDSEYDHLQTMKNADHKQTVDTNGDVYDHVTRQIASRDSDLYDHFGAKNVSNVESLYDSAKHVVNIERNSDTYDHMPQQGHALQTPDVYDHNYH